MTACRFVLVVLVLNACRFALVAFAFSACEPPPPVVDAVWTNPPSYVTPPAADATGEK